MLHHDTAEALETFRRRRASLLMRRAVLAGLVLYLLAFGTLALLDRAQFLPEALRPWLSFAAYAVVIGASWRFGLRQVVRRSVPLETAQLMEVAIPQLHEQLVPAIELANVHPDLSSNGDSPEFRSFLQESVAKQVRSIHWPQIFPADALTLWWKKLAASSLLVAVLLFVPSLHFAGFFIRAALPFASLERPSAVRIRLLTPEPTLSKVPMFSSFLFAAEIEHLESHSHPQLEWIAIEGPLTLQPMTRTWGDRFESEVLIGQNSVRFRIRAGDALTAWRTLEAAPRPSALHFAKTIQPPAYLDTPEQRLKEEHGHLVGLEGSQIAIAVTSNQALSHATVSLNPDIGDPLPLPSTELTTPETLITRFELKRGMQSWQAELSAKATGFTNLVEQPWRIEVIIDQPPTVTFSNPEALLHVLSDSTVHLTGMARDDLGIRNASLIHSVNGGSSQQVEMPIHPSSQTSLEHLFPLATLNVRDGDTVSFQWQVTDLKGQVAQSSPLQAIIREQTVPARLRAWSGVTQRIAQTADSLRTQTDQLSKYLHQKHRSDDLSSEDFQARTRAAIDDLRQTGDELASLIQGAARLPHTALAAEESRLLSAQISQFRHAILPELEPQQTDAKSSLSLARAAVTDAKKTSEKLLTSSVTFAAAASAEVAALHSEQQLRSQSALTHQALEANRDPAKKQGWQERQHGAIASTHQLIEDLNHFSESTPEGNHQNLAKEAAAKLLDAGEDLHLALDNAAPAPTPEQIYSAADQLRARLQRTSEQTRQLADHYAQKSATLRQHLGRGDTPALAALEEAKSHFLKKTPASESLAKSSKLFQDQADQTALEIENPHPEAALDASRLSRAVDQIQRSLETSAPDSDLHREAATTATQLANAARTLEADAALQRASQILSDLAAQTGSMNFNPLESRLRSANALAAAEALERAALSAPATPNLAEAAKLARQTAPLARSTSRGYADPSSEAISTELAQQAATQALDAAERLAPDTRAARQLIESLTPKISELMNQLAKDLRSDLEATETTAHQAANRAPVESVAGAVEDLQPQTAATAERLSSLQSALQQEANQADLTSAGQRDLSRIADVAIEQIRQTSPQVAEHLKQAASAKASDQQQKELEAAAATQKQSAETLEQLARHFAQTEQGQPTNAQDLAALQNAEQKLGVQEPLDQAYNRAAELAKLEELAQQDPAAALQALEQELKNNAQMQKALANLGSETAQSAAADLGQRANQPALLEAAAAEAAHELLRVARHQERLGQDEASAKLAAASQQISQAASAEPGSLTPATSRSVSDLAQTAAQTAATVNAKIPSPPTLTPFDGIQAAALAAALDQLDQEVHPRQAGTPSSAPGSNPQDQPSNPPSSQAEKAGQKLADALDGQKQSMADSRNQGKVPGSENQPSSPSPNQQPGKQDKPSQANDGGNFQLTVIEGELGPEARFTPGDWGRLPSRTAEQLSEASRREAPEEFRSAVEDYYKAIATRARQKK